MSEIPLCPSPHGGLRPFHQKSTCLQAINLKALVCKCGHVSRGFWVSRNNRSLPSGVLFHSAYMLLSSLTNEWLKNPQAKTPNSLSSAGCDIVQFASPVGCGRDRLNFSCIARLEKQCECKAATSNDAVGGSSPGSGSVFLVTL